MSDYSENADKEFLCVSGDYGGAEEFTFRAASELPRLMYGWMSGGQVEDDTKLLEWMAKSQPGDVHRYRLGWIVRVNTLNKGENND